MDTIYALSSGVVPAGLAVIRISGPETREILQAICKTLPPPRQAALQAFRRPSDGALLDRGLALWFPGPASFTGEDSAELHLHGSRAVVRAVFDSLAEQGARMAVPGEFARRAFQNGKLDLTEIEGLADLIAAETEAQRRQALDQGGGALARAAAEWQDKLTDVRVQIEARLDFSDQDDVPDEVPAGLYQVVDQVKASMRAALLHSGERLRDGYRVAILGPPNAGKSTLLNALAQRDVAIVTSEPGTTRDVLEVQLDLGGYPVRLFDTAGLRESASAAETEGVRRAKQSAADADLVLWLEEAPSDACVPVCTAAALWRIRTKADLRPGFSDGFSISARSGAGMAELVAAIQKDAEASFGAETAIVTRERQRFAIQDALTALDHLPDGGDEVTADLLRSASAAIGRLTGRIGIEDVLDRLFAEFCIGK